MGTRLTNLDYTEANFCPNCGCLVDLADSLEYLHECAACGEQYFDGNTPRYPEGLNLVPKFLFGIYLRHWVRDHSDFKELGLELPTFGEFMEDQFLMPAMMSHLIRLYLNETSQEAIWDLYRIIIPPGCPFEKHGSKGQNRLNTGGKKNE